ncbi:hypothetical protein [Mycolicibacterium aichiense]|uniref:Transmembrane protein n=1 Tax=Mycolicibacterium aichiense TaxID=1799 RepID=A0AAD1MFN5_9MYCO|nr:hypothetical protein [Mycolicibacterium aichiense]MCV7017188.1 hypothetical protein [Mycolicibacterium aichiense]BBX10384.1 hypothetical protein MAIC_51870 [Mycolicibacterium aichiense]STZ25958.1 putative transmembrane protein [Mycolicibacterium aichiense]
MDNNGPFGFDPDDIDRVVRQASEGLRDAFGQFLTSSGQGAAFGGLFDEFTRRSRPRSEPETAGEAGDGVWAIYTTDSDGKARVEQVYRDELDALRANKHNTDPTRNVRFLPYGIDVSVLDASEHTEDNNAEGESE